MQALAAIMGGLSAASVLTLFLMWTGIDVGGVASEATLSLIAGFMGFVFTAIVIGGGGAER